jgi:hypothetical protein
MTIAMQPIYTQTVSGTSTSVVNFNSIPQTFTDLKVVISSRDNNAFDTAGAVFRLNSDSGSNYSPTFLIGNSNSNTSSRSSNATSFFQLYYLQGTSTTANTFNNAEMYIPNYAGSSFKQLIVDGVTESNSASTFQVALTLGAGLYRSTSPITSMNLFANTFWTAGSSFSLYGITKG